MKKQKRKYTRRAPQPVVLYAGFNVGATERGPAMHQMLTDRIQTGEFVWRDTPKAAQEATKILTDKDQIVVCEFIAKPVKRYVARAIVEVEV